MRLLTASRMRSFRDCARLHHLRYVEGWRPVREGEPLWFGSAFHEGLAAWWTAQSLGDSDGALAAALLSPAFLSMDPFDRIRVEELLRGFDAAWREEARRYEVLGVEVPFEASLLNPATWRASATWRLAGKIDALLRDRETGRVLVAEWKTTSESIEDPAASYWTRLQMDAQISAYVIGAEALGHQVQEILYGVAQRPGQRPLLATPPESRKYRKDGALYAGQREVDETPEECRARIRTAIAENPARHFQRRVIPRTESQIRDFLADAWMQARAMRESERLGLAPRNPDACNRFGQCAFWPACSSGLGPGEFPAQFERHEDVNPELRTEEVQR